MKQFKIESEYLKNNCLKQVKDRLSVSNYIYVNDRNSDDERYPLQF